MVIEVEKEQVTLNKIQTFRGVDPRCYDGLQKQEKNGNVDK